MSQIKSVHRNTPRKYFHCRINWYNFKNCKITLGRNSIHRFWAGCLGLRQGAALQEIIDLIWLIQKSYITRGKDDIRKSPYLIPCYYNWTSVREDQGPLEDYFLKQRGSKSNLPFTCKLYWQCKMMDGFITGWNRSKTTSHFKVEGFVKMLQIKCCKTLSYFLWECFKYLGLILDNKLNFDHAMVIL